METTDNNNIQQLERLREQVKKQEKMASLGVLSAGVIHEIQNPLNFVINFSKMSNSLLTDLQEIIDDNKDKLAANDQEEISDIMNDLNENLSKIAEHGNRAISIIRNILLYSRGKEDEYIPTDICKLTKEYVWLSYHSMRANYQGFNVTINENYQKDIPMITVVPQDFSRAVLNVMNNACYAVWNKAQNLTGDADTYHPTISVDVKVESNELNTTITDNGEGMTEEVKQKLFDTFFTTKPVGHGTGLGMSITRQIIEEKHHGRIEFDSKRGEFTTFSLIIPIKK